MGSAQLSPLIDGRPDRISSSSSSSAFVLVVLLLRGTVRGSPRWASPCVRQERKGEMDAGDVDMTAPEATETVNALPLALYLPVAARQWRSFRSIDWFADLRLRSLSFCVGGRDRANGVAVLELIFCGLCGHCRSWTIWRGDSRRWKTRLLLSARCRPKSRGRWALDKVFTLLPPICFRVSFQFECILIWMSKSTHVLAKLIFLSSNGYVWKLILVIVNWFT